jgi:hypothetical protein
MKRVLLLALGLGLAGCGTPQQQCINKVTRDLRTVDRLIVETQGNLQRGYALEEVTTYRTVWVACESRPIRNADGTVSYAPPRMCLDDRPETTTRPKAIDLAAEARTLDSLKAKRRSLARDAEAPIAQCKAQYPEA